MKLLVDVDAEQQEIPNGSLGWVWGRWDLGLFMKSDGKWVPDPVTAAARGSELDG